MARPHVEDPKTVRLMARVTKDEAERYKQHAADVGVRPSEWFRLALHAAAGDPPMRNPVANADALSAVLRQIGAIGSNVNQMARRANMGSWPEAEAIQHAREDIQMIRDYVMKALGVPNPGEPQP